VKGRTAASPGASRRGLRFRRAPPRAERASGPGSLGFGRTTAPMRDRRGRSWIPLRVAFSLAGGENDSHSQYRVMGNLSFLRPLLLLFLLLAACATAVPPASETPEVP